MLLEQLLTKPYLFVVIILFIAHFIRSSLCLLSFSSPFSIYRFLYRSFVALLSLLSLSLASRSSLSSHFIIARHYIPRSSLFITRSTLLFVPHNISLVALFISFILIYRSSLFYRSSLIFSYLLCYLTYSFTFIAHFIRSSLSSLFIFSLSLVRRSFIAPLFIARHYIPRSSLSFSFIARLFVPRFIIVIIIARPNVRSSLISFALLYVLFVYSTLLLALPYYSFLIIYRSS